MSYYDSLMEKGKTDPMGAAAEMTVGLMRGNAQEYKLGYSIGNALISAAERFLTTGGAGYSTSSQLKDMIGQMGVLVEKVVAQTTEHHSATLRPYVVVILDGGLVTDTISCPGLGTPIIEVLDMDRGDESRQHTIEFLSRVDDVVRELGRRGFRMTGWTIEIARMKARVADQPTDFEEGEA